MISSFKASHPEYEDREVNAMRDALLRSGDIKRIWGTTSDTRYQITESGKLKLKL